MQIQELLEAIGQQGLPDVYVDMDGVLADFFKEYQKVSDNPVRSPADVPPAKNDPTLAKMAGTDFYNRLDKYPSADALIDAVVSLFGGYKICSSPLRNDFENSERNKRHWIARHLSPAPDEILITHRKEKHAKQRDGTANVLIDDKPFNITKWENAGGIGILYDAGQHHVGQAINQLKSIKGSNDV